MKRSLLGRVARPGAGAQAEEGVIGQRGWPRRGRGRGTARPLARRAPRRRRASPAGISVRAVGAIVAAGGARDALAAGEAARAPMAHGALDLLRHLVADLRGGERAELGGGVHGITDRQRLHLLHEAPLELVEDLLVHDEALGRDAGLAVVDDARLHGRGGRGIQIGAGHDDERVAAAQLQHRLLDVLAGRCRHRAARRLAAGERHGADARVGDHARPPRGADEQRLELALAEAGAAEDRPRWPARTAAHWRRA